MLPYLNDIRKILGLRLISLPRRVEVDVRVLEVRLLPSCLVRRRIVQHGDVLQRHTPFLEVRLLLLIQTRPSLQHLEADDAGLGVQGLGRFSRLIPLL